MEAVPRGKGGPLPGPLWKWAGVALSPSRLLGEKDVFCVTFDPISAQHASGKPFTAGNGDVHASEHWRRFLQQPLTSS